MRSNFRTLPPTNHALYVVFKKEWRKAEVGISENKAGYTATLVACGWAGAVLEKVTRASGQEPYAQKAHKRRKSKKGTNRPTD